MIRRLLVQPQHRLRGTHFCSPCISLGKDSHFLILRKRNLTLQKLELVLGGKERSSNINNFDTTLSGQQAPGITFWGHASEQSHKGIVPHLQLVRLCGTLQRIARKIIISKKSRHTPRVAINYVYPRGGNSNVRKATRLSLLCVLSPSIRSVPAAHPPHLSLKNLNLFRRLDHGRPMKQSTPDHSPGTTELNLDKESLLIQRHINGNNFPATRQDLLKEAPTVTISR